jgi:hypothetical protein
MSANVRLMGIYMMVDMRQYKRMRVQVCKLSDLALAVMESLNDAKLDRVNAAMRSLMNWEWPPKNLFKLR